MKHKTSFYWEVRRQDCGFFEYTHRNCWTNSIRCKTLSAAMKHIYRNLNSNVPVVLEKWTRLSKTSPRWHYHPKGTYVCIEYYYSPE
jgi:hypothetical protein